jgi:hypothetical protein
MMMADTPPLTSCDFCEVVNGVPLFRFGTPFGPMKVTSKWKGIAVSWADEAKLSFGTNYGTDDEINIWDGFRVITLPEVRSGILYHFTLLWHF